MNDREQPRPNLLVILPHDLGDRLGCYGYRSVSSPNLDALAEEGARLPRLFTTAPECTPSRAGMFTGQYIHQNGLMGLCHRGWGFNRDVFHLAQALSQGGYRTYQFGMQHVTGDDPTWLGYEHVDHEQAKHSKQVSERFVQFLEEDKSDQPWFAHVGFRDVHRGSGWPENRHFDPARIELPASLPDTPAVREEFCRYHQSIEDMDAAVGRMLRALEDSGDAPNTLVVFVTDHGSPFPGGKSTLYDPGIQIACLMRWPGHFASGQAPDALLSNLDLFPTILEACGVNPPQNIAGRSFLPLLKNEAYQPRDCVFGTLYYDAAYDPMCYVRSRDHKYIRSFAPTPEYAPDIAEHMLADRRTGRWIRAGDTDVQKSAAWTDMSDVDASVPPEELYDLNTDPHETNNLADDPQHAQLLQTMRTHLQTMMDQSNCPLLHAHVSPELSRTLNEHVV